jgi:hypothetical protein
MSVPEVHHWLAGDEFNANRMNEVGDLINWITNPPMVHVSRQSTGQVIPSNTWTKISFDTVVNSYDPYDFYDSGTPDQLTIREAGWYTCELSFSAVITVDSRVIMGLYKNGFTSNELLLRYDQTTLPTGNSINFRKESTLFFNVGDWMYYGVLCDASGFTTTVTSSAEVCGLRIRWVSN